MAFSSTWNSTYKALPADSEDARLGAGRIRDLKRDITERMVIDHSWAGDASDGTHNQLTLNKLAADPTNAANIGFLYVKDVGAGVIELFYEDHDGNVLQLTDAGGLLLVGNLVGDVTGNADTATSATSATSATTAANLSGTPTLPDGTAAATQAEGDNSTKLATTEYCDTAVATATAALTAGTNYNGVPYWFGQVMTASDINFTEVGNALIAKTGTYRVSITSSYVSGNPTNHVRIYKNGVAFGTDTAFNNSSTTECYNEDLAFVAGDYMQVFVHNAGVGNVSVTGWKLGTVETEVLKSIYATIGKRAS